MDSLLSEVSFILVLRRVRAVVSRGRGPFLMRSAMVKAGHEIKSEAGCLFRNRLRSIL